MFDITVDLANDMALIIPVGENLLPEAITFTRLDVDHPANITFFDKQDKPVKLLPRTSVRQINFQTLVPAIEQAGTVKSSE